MAITISRRALLLTAVAAAALIALTLFLLGPRLSDEDRNPIRVKNKKLRIETEDKDAKWHKPGAAGKWRLDVGNRLTTDRYTVTAFGADPAAECPAQMSGNSVEFQFQAGPNLHVLTFSFQPQSSGANPKLEPVLDTASTLKDDNSKKVKKLQIDGDPEGAITSLIVRDAATQIGKCSFPGDRRVIVELCMHNCS